MASFKAGLKAYKSGMAKARGSKARFSVVMDLHKRGLLFSKSGKRVKSSFQAYAIAKSVSSTKKQRKAYRSKLKRIRAALG